MAGPLHEDIYQSRLCDSSPVNRKLLIPLALQISALKCSGQKFITQQYKNEVLKE